MEKTRKDWHITSKQHEWKSARLQAKKEYQRKCEEIRTNQQDQEAVLRRNYVANLDEADRLAFVSQQKEGGAR